MFTMCNAALNACGDTAMLDVTELNNDGIIRFVDVHYQTERNLSFFPKEIQSTMTPVCASLFFQQLT